MARDPFAELGLPSSASAADIREARRRLAKRHHPDAGGDGARMGEVNAAVDAALRAGSTGGAPVPNADAPPPDASGHVSRSRRHGHEVARDVPSFTVEALPVETFEALLLVAADIADVVDEDPPYRLEVVVRAPTHCWCRLEVVPDAGASTVSLYVGALDGHPRPSTAVVRDLWINALNDLDWPAPDASGR